MGTRMAMRAAQSRHELAICDMGTGACADVAAARALWQAIMAVARQFRFLSRERPRVYCCLLRTLVAAVERGPRAQRLVRVLAASKSNRLDADQRVVRTSHMVIVA